MSTSFQKTTYKDVIFPKDYIFQHYFEDYPVENYPQFIAMLSKKDRKRKPITNPEQPIT
jgi:hypothetical protein